MAWPKPITQMRGIACQPITTVVALEREAVDSKPRAFAAHATQQDFQELYGRIQDAYGSEEQYHLAASRVGFADGEENDLFARISNES